MVGIKIETEADRKEFIGQIIDVFEDYLDKRGVKINNNEKGNDDTEAIIFGTDYDELSEGLNHLINNWSKI